MELADLYRKEMNNPYANTIVSDSEGNSFYDEDYVLWLEEKLKIKTPTPTEEELYEKAIQHTDVVCSLQNFFEQDEINIIRMHYTCGYRKALKDVNNFIFGENNK